MPTNTVDKKSPAMSFWKQSRQGFASCFTSVIVVPPNHADTLPALQGGTSGLPLSSASIQAARIIAAPTELPETVESANIRLRTSPGLPLASISAPTTVAVKKPARLAPPAPATTIGRTSQGVCRQLLAFHASIASTIVACCRAVVAASFGGAIQRTSL